MIRKYGVERELMINHQQRMHKLILLVVKYLQFQILQKRAILDPGQKTSIFLITSAPETQFFKGFDVLINYILASLLSIHFTFDLQTKICPYNRVHLILIICVVSLQNTFRNNIQMRHINLTRQFELLYYRRFSF